MIFPISIDAIRFVRNAFSLSKVDTQPNHVVRAEYPGLNGEYVPLKIIYPKGKIRKIVILYPGATPFGEDHEEATSLAHVMSGLGFKVYMPRIPLLMQLIISPENVEWMAHFYQWVLTQEPALKIRITVVGMSFGGALLLKACMDSRMQSPHPASIMIYSTFFDFDSSMNFLITGKFRHNNNEVHIKPNDWAGIVIMHNYLRHVNPGFDTEKIRENLSFRVADEMDKVDEHFKTLSDFDQSFVESLMTANYNSDVLKTIQLIRETCRKELEDLSPRLWCSQFQQKVFILHGANDSMVPFTESVRLSETLPRNMLHISHLYGHKTIERMGNIWFLLKEAYGLVRFLYHFLNHNEHSNI